MGKKFIDKKKSVTYRLVPNETGPEQFEENVPKHTLVLVPGKKNKKVAEELNKPPMIPVRNVDQPEREFPSKGPRPDWDPDVVACLDDDFDPANPDSLLEDDFVLKANSAKPLYDASCSEEEEEDDDDDDSESLDSDFSGMFSDDDGDEVPGNKLKFHSEKSRFTEYSMTSAITNCTEDVQLLNDKFEKLLEEYDDDQLGALDGEDISCKESTEAECVTQIMDGKFIEDEETFVLDKCEEELKRKILENPDRSEGVVAVVIEDKIPFDCVSLAESDASYLYQPSVIPACFERKKKSSVSSDVHNLKSGAQDGIGRRDRKTSCDSQQSCSVPLTRQKDETPEQRRERKQLVKASRRESRQIKKEVKLAFKNEKKKQSVIVANAHRTVGFKI